uniref:Regulator of G-protein signaling 20 n=1 Tax=Dromaius novaehollandiae TaxID=8790 RepID=A0A8C4IUT0_DRONO
MLPGRAVLAAWGRGAGTGGRGSVCDGCGAARLLRGDLGSRERGRGGSHTEVVHRISFFFFPKKKSIEHVCKRLREPAFTRASSGPGRRTRGRAALARRGKAAASGASPCRGFPKKGLNSSFEFATSLTTPFPVRGCVRLLFFSASFFFLARLLPLSPPRRPSLQGARRHGPPGAPPRAAGSAEEAAGTLARAPPGLGSPAAPQRRGAAPGAPQHDPATSAVHEAGTQRAGPASAEPPLPMSRHEASPTTVQPAGHHRPNACCFCWCCCCSCSWNEDRERAWRASRETKLETIPNCEACARPTAEEVRGWAQSFDKLMKSPAGRNVFREFLRTEYSEENMLFWLACEELKSECNKHTIDEKARTIYEDYISILSPKEVSLDSRVREVINRKMQEPSSHTFDDAQLQIYTLMHRDSYPRFLNSAIYKALLHSVSRSSSES